MSADYDEVFLDALQRVLDSYRETEIDLTSEADLKGHLFHECVTLMKQRGLPMPFRIYAEKGVFEKRRKVDLVLGNDEVLIELKFEPYDSLTGQGRVFTTIKEAGSPGYSTVEEDLQKIEQYARKGKNAHFVMIDETGWHAETIVQSRWNSITAGKKQVFMLHIHKGTGNDDTACALRDQI